MAAIAVLAVAFVVFAAIPAVDAEGAASTYYVDSESGIDTNAGTDEAPFKTLNKAIETATSGSKILLKGDVGTETTVNCDKYLLAGHLNAAIKVNKSLTIESASVNEKAVIPYALWICEDSSNQKVEVSLKNLVVDPVENDYAIGVGQGAASKLTVSGCDLKIQPYATGDDQVAAIYVYQSGTDIVVENSNFKIDGNKGNGYTSAIMVWQGKATINHNVVDGYSKFLNIDGMTELTVTDNTAKNMLGPFKTSRGELKNGTFIQFATTSGAQTQVTYVVNNNRVEASDASFIDIATYPTSTSPTKINALDTNMNVVFRGTVELKGATIGGNIVLDEQNGVESVVKVDDLPLANGKTLTVGNGSTLSGNVSGNGKVIVEAGANVNDATFAPETQVGGDSSSMSEMIVGGDSKTEETLFGVDQIITVSKEAGYWNLVKGATIGIAGKLVVPEGTTLTVQAGAELYFLNTATVEIEGTLVIEDGFKNTDGTDVYPGAIYQQGGKVIVAGTAQIAGDYYAEAGQFIAEQDSVVTVEETGTLVSENIVVKASANFKVEGTITDADVESIIYNYGVIIFDSKVAAVNKVTVKMMADGATVVVTNYTTEIGAKATLKIIDDEMVVYTAKDGTNTTVLKVNSIVLRVSGKTVSINEAGTNNKNVTISDVTVVEKLTSKNAKSGYGFVSAAGKAFDNRMQISGNASVSTVWSKENSETIASEKYDITLTAGRGITIPAADSGIALTAGLNVVLKNDVITDADDKVLGLTVEGAVDATAKASTSSTDVSASFVNAGTITVVKDGSIKTLAPLDSTVNATLYETGTDKIKNYVTIDSALATVNADGNTVKALTVLGKQTVNASAAIPANVVVTLKDNNTELIIGAKASDNVTLTVSKDGSLKGTGKEITVNGTLFAENKLKLTAAPIVSDVMSEEIKEGKLVRDGWIKYTNIVAALNGAEDGQTITISKKAGDGNYVTIASDISVKPGVTLVVGNNVAPLFLKNGVTLTVSGTLQTEQAIYAERMFDLKASSIKDSESSVIVVDGTLKAAQTNYGLGKLTEKNGSTVTYQASSVDGAPIAGAYYEIDKSTADKITGFGTGSKSGSSIWNNKIGPSVDGVNVKISVGGEVVYTETAISKLDSLDEVTKNGSLTLVPKQTFTIDSGIANEEGNSRKVTFVGDGTQTVDVITKADSAEGGMLNYQRGSSFTFKNLTIQAGEGSFDGIVCDELTFTDCTIKGKLTLYGEATFTNCTFDNTMKNQYSIWTWGGTDVMFENCTFNTNGKAILLYGSATALNPTKLVVNGCTFNDCNDGAAAKAAIEIGSDYNATYTLTVDGATVNGFAKGMNTGSILWANKNSMDAEHLSVIIDGKTIQ